MSEYDNLNALTENFKPFFEMWNTAYNFKESDTWTSEPLAKQDAHIIDKELDKMYKST